MIKNIYKRNGIEVVETWLAREACKEGDIVYYNDALNEIDHITSLQEGTTLIIDLNQTLDDIFNSFSKTNKYEIKKAERDGAIIETYANEAITEQYLNDYIEYYEEFHRSKNMGNERRRRFTDRLKYLRANGNLVITDAKLDNEIVVYHVYIMDERMVYLFQSCSLYRENKDKRNAIARANRLLHWKDICYFKEKKLDTYDWGGYSPDREEVKNISMFKAGFCKVIDRRYLGRGGYARTFKGKIALFFLRVKSKFYLRR